MLKKHIVMFIAAVLMIGSITGCDESGSKSKAAKSLDKLQAELVEAKEKKDEMAKAKVRTDYTYAQKKQFVNEMKKELSDIQTEMDKLSEKVAKSNSSAKQNAQKRVDSLREELEVTKVKIEEALTVEESGWEDVKKGFAKANDNLKKSFENTRQWLSDKIEP
jgi:peptidoglycan hydrolase CwlO-like protein